DVCSSDLEIAKRMEKICPDAWFLNYTNPLTKICEAINRLTSIKFVGLCHGILAGKHQLSQFLEMNEEDLEVKASGLNHITWFQSIKDKNTGEDLYPKLKSR
ncbi:MAG TPA: alpha-glucosidase/alpha-galactosidase, partial [Flavobacteriaceae bacterium]|nr:alpha-glucosidase/alpha-galactosidase [Flavobacteriaceae bacterium]